MTEHDPQLATFTTYTHLQALRPFWPGHLILSVGLDPAGEALAFAALVAGAAILTVEPSPDLARQSTRTGSTDFLVNTVDEALRILKNEIRQHKSISVAVQCAPATAEAELLERGVLPVLYRGLNGAAWTKQGTQILGEIPTLTPSIHSFATSAELRAFDQRLQQLIPAEDPRHPWLRSAPRLFHRDRRRIVTLTEGERSAS